jgi:hypothetical protein
MPARTVEGAALNDVYLGDRDLLHVAVDLRRGEGRVTFSGAALTITSEGGGRSQVELERPVLVLTGLRSLATVPATSRPETIVLKWRFAMTSDASIAEFLVVGDPEPVTLRFECERLHLES